MSTSTMQPVTTEPRRSREAIMFFLLAVMIWPVIACGIVGAYGFSFWVYFMLAGPPGPH